MIEKLKHLLELFDFIGKYPLGIRALGCLWLMNTVALGAGLLIYYPKPKPEAPPLRIVGLEIQKKAAGRTSFDVRVQNNTANSAELTRMKLSFFSDPDPTTKGALQSTRQITGKYHVIYDAKNKKAVGTLENGEETLETRINYPMSGRADYAFLSITLVQSVPHNDGDRFTITIDAEDFPPPLATHLRAVVYYNGAEETAPLEKSLVQPAAPPPGQDRKE